MGWASGSELMEKIIKSAKKEFPDIEARKRFYFVAIEAFCDHDWDTEDECIGIDEAFDRSLQDVYEKNGWDRD